MPSTNQNIRVCAGDSVSVVIQVRRIPQTFNMSGASASWAMGAQPTGSATPSVQLTKATSDGSASLTQVPGGYDLVFTLEGDDTETLSGRTFWHEAEIVTANGDHATVTSGRVFIEPTLIR